MALIDIADEEIRIEGTFVRRIGGYHGKVAEDFEWRSKSDADAAFSASRSGDVLFLRSPSWGFMHHEAGFERLEIALPRTIPVEFRFEFKRGELPHAPTLPVAVGP